MRATILLKKTSTKWIDEEVDFKDAAHLENYLKKMESFGWKDMGCNIINQEPKQSEKK